MEEFKVYRSVLLPIRILGLPINVLYGLWFFNIVLVANYQMLAWLPIGVIIHIVLTKVAKEDVFIFPIIRNILSEPDILD